MGKLFTLFIFLFFYFGSYMHAAEAYEVVSPDNRLKVILHIGEGTSYEIRHGETQLLSPSSIALHLSDGTVVGAGTVKSTNRKSEHNQVDVPIGKNKTLTEAYNELTVVYNENYELVVRAYNEGVAYRFVTDFGKEITINSEDAIFNFAANTKVYFPECDANTSQEEGDGGIRYSIHQGYRNFERVYNTYNVPVAISNKFSVTPVLFEYTGTPYKVVITEADTYDYPGMYMESNRSGGTRSMRGMWAGYPKKVMDPDNYYSNHLVYEREDFIARTNGSRKFPWRVIIVSNDDKSLLNNELVYLLAEPSRITNTAWIKPGKSAWEWWHKAMLEGVSFPVGNRNLSVDLYKYYIDWAAKNGIEYMTFDAGYQESWLTQLCKYAEDKGVKIIVWTWASCVNGYPGDWIRRMKARGVSGVKIDFFERNDQIAMRWGHEFAQRLADNEMVGLFHGCPVPTGLNRTYPNILNFEAVRGAEDNFWRSLITPDYHTLFPFIRSIAGPEDYTPGSMRNTTAEAFYPVDRDNTVPMSMGTRAHELSMYVIFDHWLGYLCDSPTEYNKFPDILDFLASVPTVWDRSLPLDARLGRYILMAKQKGDDWYVGGMTNWDARTLTVNFDFLPPNVSFDALMLKDSPDSGKEPKKYINEKMTVTKDTKLTVDMAKGGGFVIRLKKQNPNGNAGVRQEGQPFLTHVDRTTETLHIRTDQILRSVNIYDVSGKCMFSGHYKRPANAEKIRLSGLEKGIYILQIQAEHETDSFKFFY
ncbi:MAG: glycoside hydrolase family 97 catalytic domain-containing protein [Tannerella sp.]|jgi:alpha-glucosidase|nr:glycoside hydrolase family 97 catalytic domain-containing protein [Tannerella sp.]